MKQLPNPEKLKPVDLGMDSGNQFNLPQNRIQEQHTPMGGFGMYSHLREKLPSGWLSQPQDELEDEQTIALFEGTA